MAIDATDLLLMEQFAAMRRQSDAASATQQTISQGAATYLNLLDRIMLNELTTISFPEAAAMRDVMGVDTKAAGIARAMDLAEKVLVPPPGK